VLNFILWTKKEWQQNIKPKLLVMLKGLKMGYSREVFIYPPDIFLYVIRLLRKENINFNNSKDIKE